MQSQDASQRAPWAARMAAEGMGKAGKATSAAGRACSV